MKTSDFKSREELKGMTVANIRSHITKFNRHYAIKGYSKLKKDDLVEKVLSAQSRLSKTGMKKAKLKIVGKKEDTPKAPTPKPPTPKPPTPKAPTPKPPTPKPPTPKPPTPKPPTPKPALTPKTKALNTFADLPPELRKKIGEQSISRSGDELVEKYIMAKRYTPKYLKLKDIWEKLRKIQMKYIKGVKGKSKGQGRFYVGTDMERIIKTIKKNEGLNAGSIFEDMTNYLNGLINTYEQKQREDENKQKERRAKNPDKVNVSNVNNEIDWGKINDYADDFDTTANALYGLGAGYGLNEDQWERFREIIDNKMYKAYEKSIADFIKKNKSIKSAEKMAEAFMEKYKNERYEIYDWL